jgi:hypothetical protein
MYLAAVLVLIGVVSSAYAHAPGNVDLGFDLEEQLLEVTVKHQVNDGAKHYVNRVSVDLNGRKIIEQTLYAQENLKDQKLVYRITDAGVGDTISVTASCNISGKKKASVKIEAPPAEEEEGKD